MGGRASFECELNGKSDTILLIHPQRIVRECLENQLIERLPEFSVQSLGKQEDIGAVADQFSIALIVMWASALEPAAELAEACELLAPGRPVALISDLGDGERVRSALACGIRGYFTASMSTTELASAIRLICGGGTYIPASALPGIDAIAPRMDHGPAHPDFSPRQLDVLGRLQEGKPNKIIAYELGMAEATVKVHIRIIMRKLKARNRTQVVLMTRRVTGTAAPATASDHAWNETVVPLASYQKAS